MRYLFAAAALALCASAPVCEGAGVSVVFSSYRASSATNGSLYLYLVNGGAEEARIEGVYLEGEEIGELQEAGMVSWHRARPEVIAPGASAEVLIRFEALPRDMATELFLDPGAACRMKVELDLSGGRKLSDEVKISLAPEPFQLNFIGFGEELDKLYLYFQNNRWLLEGEETPLALGRIWVNGKDLTRRSRFGSRVLGGNVVPVEVSLEEPLEWGAPAVVTAEAAGGFMAGHALRAFPSEFHIQVTLWHQQIREDAVRDVYNHCATSVSVSTHERLAEAAKLGLDLFFFGGTLRLMQRFWEPDYPRIKGFWLDEMDRHPAKVSLNRIKSIEDHYAARNRLIPPFGLNIMGPSSPGGQNYLEIGDGIIHGYGMDGGDLGGEGFARFETLRRREYRLSRRPFWPYLRNAEAGLELDPDSGRIIGLSPRAYPIHPKEERWLTYGCLMQGAKGILHWAYGVRYRPPPDWMSREHQSLRLSMGGLPGNMAHGYRIPDEIVSDLRDTWREIGRINAELQTIGPLAARSDVCRRAKITRASPEPSGSFGDATAEAGTLISGLDSMVLVVLNMNMSTRWSSRNRGRDDRVTSYPPADVTVEVELPEWMEAGDVFTVCHTGLERVRPRMLEGRRMELRFPEVEVSRIVVITADRELYAAMENTLEEMRRRLARIEKDAPVPILSLTERR